MIIYRKIISDNKTREVYLYDTEKNQEKLIWHDGKLSTFSKVGNGGWQSHFRLEADGAWSRWMHEIDISAEEAFEIML